MHTPVNNFHENHHHLTYDARRKEDTANIKKEKLWFKLVKIVSCLNSCNGRYRNIINYALHNIYTTNTFNKYILNEYREPDYFKT